MIHPLYIIDAALCLAVIPVCSWAAWRVFNHFVLGSL